MREPVEDVGPPPCYECSSFDYCAFNKKACRDFKIYVRTGELVNRNRQPWSFIYNSIFRGNEGYYGRS